MTLSRRFPARINRVDLATASGGGGRGFGRDLSHKLRQFPGLSHKRLGLTIFGLLAAGVMALAALTPAQGQDAEALVAEITAGLGVWKSSGCTGCHGKFAEGGGGGEQPSGPSLRGLDVDHQRIVEQITEGGQSMPAFDGVVTPDEIQALATFLMERVIGRDHVTVEECTFYYGLYQGGLHPSCLKYQ